MYPQAEKEVCVEGGPGVHPAGTQPFNRCCLPTRKAFPSAISRESEIGVTKINLFHS